MTAVKESTVLRPDLLDLGGKRVLVTGAGQGVGREIALTVAAHGASVVVNDYNRGRAEQVANEVATVGGTAFVAACDVTEFDDVQRMVAETGPIDILVNNAGNAGPENDPLNPAPPFWETDPSDWHSWLDTNLYGVMTCTRAALPGMVERRWGRVITIVSDAGRVGEPLA